MKNGQIKNNHYKMNVLQFREYDVYLREAISELDMHAFSFHKLQKGVYGMAAESVYSD